jgi:hypothetical protein
MVVVIRVGAGLIRRMGENPPAGFCRRTALARLSAALEAEVKLVERWNGDPREIEHQQDRRSAACPRRAHGSVGSTSPSARAITHDEST